MAGLVLGDDVLRLLAGVLGVLAFVLLLLLVVTGFRGELPISGRVGSSGLANLPFPRYLVFTVG